MPLFEEIMLMLMEKYILKCEDYFIFKLRLFDSQMVFFPELKYDEKKREYTCEERYYLYADAHAIKTEIGNYFRWLDGKLRYVGNGLSEYYRQRIRNLIFIMMINLNYGRNVRYGVALFEKHMRILSNCGTDKYLLNKIRTIVERKKYGSSNDLVELLYENSTEGVNLV